jgi:8-oxo-dGTP pyrophosphatase MutT (NUDIX family)
MPAVGAVAFDRQGNLLLQRRTDNGEWSVPVGGMDPYESPSDAVVREVWEETGVLVEPLRVLGVYGGAKQPHIHPNGDQTTSVFILFECLAHEGAPTPDGIESCDARFVPVAEALSMLSPYWQKRLAPILTGRAEPYFQAATWQP